MSAVHLSEVGEWEACEGSCPLPLHVPGLSVEEAKLLPQSMVDQLCEAFDPPTYLNAEGWKRWEDAPNRSHRDYGLPAQIWPNGERQWAQHGKLHRDGDLPAVVGPDGGRWWYQHGQRHRDGDQPAVIRPDGGLRWFQRDELHRENDLPALVDPDGSQCWFVRGVRHRNNGKPAVVIPNHVMEWYEHGKLHCETGPARVSAEGPDEYWLRGLQVDELRITELIAAKRGY